MKEQHDKYLPLSEVATEIGKSRQTLFNWAKQGMPTITINGMLYTDVETAENFKSIQNIVMDLEDEEIQKLILRIRNHKYKAKKNNVLSSFSLLDWYNTLDYFDNKCAYCQQKTDKLLIEHIINKGNFSPDNIVCACYSCNISKSNNDFEEWYKKTSFYDEKQLDKIKQYIDNGYKISNKRFIKQEISEIKEQLAIVAKMLQGEMEKLQMQIVTHELMRIQDYIVRLENKTEVINNE